MRASHRTQTWTLRCAALLSLCMCASSCGGHRTQSSSAEVEQNCELRYLGSNSNVNFTELAEDLGYLAPCKLKWVGNVLGGPESIQAVTTGDVDFGGAATGSVLKLIAAGAPITQVLISAGVDSRTWGGYFVLENSPLQNARDLIGKKIAVNTLGAHAEFIIREYLRRGGLSTQEIKDVTLIVTPPINAEQTLRAGQVDVASLSGITRDRALQRGGIRPLFTDYQLFGAFNSSTLVVRKDAFTKRPFAMRMYVEATARAIAWMQDTPVEEVRARIKRILSQRGRNEDPELANYWHSAGIRTRGGLIEDRDIQMWIDWFKNEPDLLVGKLGKPSATYTNELNPYRVTHTTANADPVPRP